LRLGFPLTRNLPLKPPHPSAGGGAGVPSPVVAGWPAGRRASSADLQTLGGAPLLLLSPSSILVCGPHVRRCAPPAAGRWPAFRGRR
jgi:hypothetical protein